MRRTTIWTAAFAVLALMTAVILYFGLTRPSHSRAWRSEQGRLPVISREGSLIHVKNVRNFSFQSADSFTPGYHDRTYDLDELETVWFVISPFSRDWRGPAHVFVSFGFADSQYVSISVEARREEGEDYSVLKGLLRRFELMYVIGEERDLIGLRAAIWDDPTYLYPIRTTPDKAKELFVLLVDRAQAVSQNPEFYNTFINNCTTNILDAVNQIAENPVPYGVNILLPGNSDKLAYEMGWLDTDLPLEQARSLFEINQRAKQAGQAADFSQRIRS